MATDKKKMTEAQLANLEKGRFKPGQSGNPAGRPKSKVRPVLTSVLNRTKKEAKQRNEMTTEEINEWERQLLAMTVEELKILINTESDKVPAYAKSVAFAMVIDMKSGKFDTVNKIRERQYGKTLEQIDITTGGQPLNTPAPQVLTPAEAKAFLQRLEEEY
jgi:hypothetical protein